MSRVRAVWFVLVMALAFTACGDSFSDSPFATAIPNCPDGWSERTAVYQAPPKGRVYSEAGARSVTWRSCGQGDFVRSVEVLQFSDEEDASLWIHRDLIGVEPSDWYPPPPTSEGLGYGHSSSVSECLRAEDPKLEDLLDSCVVGAGFMARLGKVVVEVHGEDRGARIDYRRLRLGFSSVDGDARGLESAELMARVVEHLASGGLR